MGRTRAKERETFSAGGLTLVAGFILPVLMPGAIAAGVAMIAEYRKWVHGLALIVPATPWFVLRTESL